MLENKRLILPGFLSHDTCKELEFIHKSCSTVGYRANVFSTTLAHLIATNCASLIMPFIPIREKLRETIEDFFDCQLELFIEFTGLISWTKGASIGWHSDDNRPYLKQRQYAVAETRFASHTIVLRRLVRVKEALCQMVISNKWGGWKQVDTEKAKIVKDLIFSDDFWNRVEYALELTEPLMSMLRYADTDEPCLGNIYDAMDSMLERMKSVIQRREQDPDTLYSTVEKIVLHRWNKMTTPLHLLAYALSPRYYSNEILDIPGRVPPYRDPEVAAGYKKALNKLFSDPDVASNVRREFVDFVSSKFAEPDAINDQSRLDAIGWWYLHGERYMYLQPLAIKILSQAVCYLNNYNEDFKGGLFHFQDSEPKTIVPKIGDAILYTADESNIHCVDKITEGERCTLTLWFTRDSSHNEDAKLISQLSNCLNPFLNPDGVKDTDSNLLMSYGAKKMMMQKSSSKSAELIDSETVTSHNASAYLHFFSDFILENWLPLPASDNMYWVNRDHLMMEEAHDSFVGLEEQYLGFDIRWARILLLGFEFCFDKDADNLKECETKMKETDHDYTLYSSDSLDKTLHLKRKGILLPELFRNSLHALQVVLFYRWKFWKRPSNCVEDYCYGFGAETATGASAGHRELQAHSCNLLRNVLCKKFRVQDTALPDCIVDYPASSHEDQHRFNYEDFVQAIDGWKHYLCTLSRALLLSFPQWEENKILFPV